MKKIKKYYESKTLLMIVLLVVSLATEEHSHRIVHGLAAGLIYLDMRK